jgi:hypothetical protein
LPGRRTPTWAAEAIGPDAAVGSRCCAGPGHDLDPADVAATAVRRLRELADFAAVRAGAGAPHLDDHARLYRDDADWLGASLQELR